MTLPKISASNIQLSLLTDINSDSIGQPGDVVKVQWDSQADNNPLYASQFGEPVESGSSVSNADGVTGSRKTTLPGVIGFSNPNGISCSGYMNYSQAVELTESMGARLPTIRELESNCTQGTGCGYDLELCWTQTLDDASSKRWVGPGNVNHSLTKQLKAETETAVVRYVYDKPALSAKNILEVKADFSQFGSGQITMDDNGSGTFTAEYILQSEIDAINAQVTLTVTNALGNQQTQQSDQAILLQPIATHLYNSGYAVTDKNPNFCEELQSGKIALAYSQQDESLFVFKPSRPPGEKWVLV
jgi:hypothetical protein